MKKIILKVEGMSCSACSNHVEKYLNKQKGVIDASVNLVLAQALIHYEDDISIETLGQYIEQSGYKFGGIYDEKLENKKDNQLVYLIGFGILIIFIMYLTMGHMLNLPSIPFLNMMVHPQNYVLFLAFLTIFYLIYGSDILIRGIKNLFHKSPNMDTLVAVGVLTSFIYSFINLILVMLGQTQYVKNLYFESVCMIILFIKLGRYIDQNSKEKTKEAIKELVGVTPAYALLKTKNGDEKITIDEVKVGDILIAKAGMKIAVDGKIVKGSAHFDESFINGESQPVKKTVNDHVVAGSINYDGMIWYEAEKIGPKSTISEMVHLVLEASNSKMPISKLADKVSSYFVPLIMLISLLTFGGYLILGFSLNEAIIHMVTVLVVACPCALGLATPLAVIVAIGKASKENILIKTSETLEIASHIKTIVFDKTGTLTYGQLQVNKIYNYSSYSDADLLNIVSNIEKNSTHPIAQAFDKYFQQKLEISNYQDLSGVGVTAKIGEKNYKLGNFKIVNKIPQAYQEVAKELANLGNSLIFVAENEQIIGLIGVKDTIKKEAPKTIKKLQEAGYKVVMLTGDNETTATIIGEELGISNVIANVLPSQKVNYLKELKENGNKVMMVGDGINDAPSLTTADIGVSFQSSTDIAANCAGVIITNDKLDSILTFLKIGHKTLVNIKQNLFWAFFYNTLMIPIAIGFFKNIGLEINPMLASLAMMLSSLCVVFNALRLKRIK